MKPSGEGAVPRQRRGGGLGVGWATSSSSAVNNIIVGNPETVIRKLTQIIQRLNPGYLHIYGNEGAMNPKAVMRSIELLGKEVIPALHEIELPEYYE